MDVKEALDQMHELFKDFPVTELNYSTPFQCLIAVMMSAQTTDIQVNKVTDELYKKIKNPWDILKMWDKALWEHIRTVGLWTSKKKNIMATAKILQERTTTLQDAYSWNHFLEEEDLVCIDSEDILQKWWYYLPDTIEWMLELPWVGVKTAKVVLYVLYRQRRVAVDTHVHRVMNRLWFIQTKTPDQSSKKLEILIPDEYKDIAHHSIIYFGRYLCKAKKPECHRCPLQQHCKWYKENIF